MIQIANGNRATNPLLIILAMTACSPEGESGRSEDSTIQPTAPVYFLQDGADGTGRYIVLLKEDAFEGSTADAILDEFSEYSIEKVLSFNHLHGFVARLKDDEIQSLARSPLVELVEEEQFLTVNGDQDATDYGPELPWGLDRVDQADLPLDRSYTADTSGFGVDVYIVDSGIRGSHEEFHGRMGNSFELGRGEIQGDQAQDCHGHGTHVAGTAGGSTSGVAPGVTLHSVKVLDCENNGNVSGIADGLGWVESDARGKAAVVNMSISAFSVSPTFNLAIQNLVNAGITVVVAAGNFDSNACAISPAAEPSAIAVAASDGDDVRSSFSNWGPCVDIFAPGEWILSAGNMTDTHRQYKDGTSMATPHVAGAAALYLESHPDASPEEIADALTGYAASGRITDTQGSPNLLLNTEFMGGRDAMTGDSCASPNNGQENSCGSAAAGRTCWCDTTCERVGDCCYDYQDVCA